MLLPKDKLADIIAKAKQAAIPANIAQRCIPLLDLTSLNDTDNDSVITQLCTQALTPLGSVVAVCVYPQFVKLAKHLLNNTQVRIATVANFPAGEFDIDATLITIAQALKDGADEIDVVMPYRTYLAGDQTMLEPFVKVCKQTCGDATLKVILETGALQQAEVIYAASCAAIAGGADFLKTSTGKVAVGATLEAAAVMLWAIKESGQKVGFKAAGGVRTVEQAAEYMQLAELMMGANWISPKTFRLGTSSLLEKLSIYM